MSLVAKELTALIERVQAGEDGARDELFSEVYDELRALARRRMRKERPDHTRVERVVAIGARSYHYSDFNTKEPGAASERLYGRVS